MNEELKAIAIQIGMSLAIIRKELEDLEQLKNELRKQSDKK